MNWSAIYDRLHGLLGGTIMLRVPFLERRVWFVKVSVVGIFVVAMIDGHLCGCVAEASQTWPDAVRWFGPAFQLEELRRELAEKLGRTYA